MFDTPHSIRRESAIGRSAGPSNAFDFDLQYHHTLHQKRRLTLQRHESLGNHLGAPLTPSRRMLLPVRHSASIDLETTEELEERSGNAVPSSEDSELNYANTMVHRTSDDLSMGGKMSKSSAGGFWAMLLVHVQVAYEKSQISRTFPLLLLICYSFLGGVCFYYLERGRETDFIKLKGDYIKESRENILQLVWRYRQQVKDYNHSVHSGKISRSDYDKKVDELKPWALRDLKHVVYWYALSRYYLTDNESYKITALNPKNPEKLQKHKFRTVLGRLDALQIYTNQLVERCWEVCREENGEFLHSRRKLDPSIELFNNLTGLHGALEPSWTFWNSMFLAVTTYTTIGYGNIAPKTDWGKLFAIVYAIIGIPLFFMILHKLGRFFLHNLQKLWDFLASSFGACHDEPERSTIYFESSAGRESYSIPVSLAVGVTFGWMFLCARLFLFIEKDWTYFKSVYFFFISLTTIGYGDVTPSRSENMFFIFFLILIGLSLVSMCFNVVQIKLEQLFEDLLLMMLEEYQAAEGKPPDIQGKMGAVQLLKMWNKRRQKKRAEKLAQQQLLQQQNVLSPVNASIGDSLPSVSDNDTQAQQRADYRNNMSNMMLLRMVARQRRNLILDEWRRKGRLRHKATQTGDVVRRRSVALQTIPLRHSFDYDDWIIEPSAYQIEEAAFFDEVDEQERVSPMSLSDLSTLQNLPLVREGSWESGSQEFLENPQFLDDTQRVLLLNNNLFGDHFDDDQLRRVCDPLVLGEKETLPFENSAFRTANLVYPPLTHVLKNNATTTQPMTVSIRDQTQPQTVKTRSSVASQSTHLSNSSSAVTTPVSRYPAGFDPGVRRWTFLETGRAPRGAPRGLIVPTMCVNKQSKDVYKDDLKGLMKEIDLRLSDCRTIVGSSGSLSSRPPSSSAPSSSRHTASTLQRSTSPRRPSQVTSTSDPL